MRANVIEKDYKGRHNVAYLFDDAAGCAYVDTCHEAAIRLQKLGAFVLDVDDWVPVTKSNFPRTGRWLRSQRAVRYSIPNCGEFIGLRVDLDVERPKAEFMEVRMPDLLEEILQNKRVAVSYNPHCNTPLRREMATKLSNLVCSRRRP